MSASWDPRCIFTDEGPIVPTATLAPSFLLPTRRSGGSNKQSSHRLPGDFLAFLALAQNLGVDFLPITWHPAVQTLGAGTTAEVRQALVDIQTNFAFKRIGLERHDAFAALTSEVSVLKTVEVDQHDNIIRLVGICWDVDPAGPTIWPVLVFEKAPYGSLDEFMQSDRGKAISATQMLSMMADIARALDCLQRNCVFLPQNTLCVSCGI